MSLVQVLDFAQKAVGFGFEAVHGALKDAMQDTGQECHCRFDMHGADVRHVFNCGCDGRKQAQKGTALALLAHQSKSVPFEITVENSGGEVSAMQLISLMFTKECVKERAAAVKSVATTATAATPTTTVGCGGIKNV